MQVFFCGVLLIKILGRETYVRAQPVLLKYYYVIVLTINCWGKLTYCEIIYNFNFSCLLSENFHIIKAGLIFQQTAAHNQIQFVRYTLTEVIFLFHIGYKEGGVSKMAEVLLIVTMSCLQRLFFFAVPQRNGLWRLDRCDGMIFPPVHSFLRASGIILAHMPQKADTKSC